MWDYTGLNSVSPPAPLRGAGPPGEHGQHGGEGDPLPQTLDNTHLGRAGTVDRGSSLTALYRVEEVDAATVGGQGGDESEDGRDQHSCTGTGHSEPP